MAAPQSSAALPHSRLNTAPRAEALPTSPDAFQWRGPAPLDADVRAALERALQADPSLDAVAPIDADALALAWSLEADEDPVAAAWTWAPRVALPIAGRSPPALWRGAASAEAIGPRIALLPWLAARGGATPPVDPIGWRPDGLRTMRWPATRAGLDGRPVVLHVLHDWGGGVARFVALQARQDPDAHHLALVSGGDVTRGHGRWLALRPADGDLPFRRWSLSPPAGDLSIDHPGVRAALEEVLAAFGIGAVRVSSLIGHSLDVLRTGLPTAFVVHDLLPFWPVLDDAADAAPDPARIATAARDPQWPFQCRDPETWAARVAATTAALLATRPVLVAPSTFALARLRHVVPALADLDAHVVPHGVPRGPLRAGTRAGGPLRVLVPGRLAGGKGERLLDALLPIAPAGIDWCFVGGGEAAGRYAQATGGRAVPDYPGDAMDEALGGFDPDLALLPSTLPETFGFVLSEMLARGIPVLAADVGAYGERLRAAGMAPIEPTPAAFAHALAAAAAHPASLTRRVPAPPDLDAARAGWSAVQPVPAPRRGGAVESASVMQHEHAILGLAVAALARERDTAYAFYDRDTADLTRQRDAALAHADAMSAAVHEAGARIVALETERDALASTLTTLHEDLAGARQEADHHRRERDPAYGFYERDTADLIRQRDVALSQRDALQDQLQRTTALVRHPLVRLPAALALRGGDVRVALHYRWQRLRALAERGLRSLRQRGLGATLAAVRHRLLPEAPAPVVDGTVDAPIAFPIPAGAVRASIVIPVHGKLEYTLACLRALAGGGLPDGTEVIVVDDASPDDTGDVLPTLPGLRYHRNHRNLGFVGSCNAGAAMAHGEYVVFLNNDTTPSPGWLQALLGTFASHPDTGLAGAQLVYPDGRLQESGGIVFADGSGWNYGRFEAPRHPAYGFVREVDYCSGAAIALPRALFERLGGFDERYAPAYYEDTDLAMKVRDAGLKVRVQPASVVVHHEGITAGTDTGSGVKAYQVRNQGRFVERWSDALRRHPAPGQEPVYAAQHRARARVLVIDATTPMPDRDSGSVRLFELLRLLVDEGCAVSFFAENGLDDGPYTEALRQLGVEAWTQPWLGGIPDWLARHGARFQLVVVSRHYVLSPLLPLLRRHAPQARIVFDTVDLHHLREAREAERLGDPALLRASARTREAELSLVRAVDRTWVVSPVEQALLATQAPGCIVDVVSNIHRPRGRGPGRAARRDLLFVGGFRHPPNVDAARWLADEIMPRLRDARPDIGLSLVGSDAPAEIVALGQRPGITVHGFVPDLEPMLDSHRLSVAPLRYGAGVKGKVNQALAHGLPVVATRCAIEGMGLEDGRDVLVADDTGAFVDAVLRAYEDDALWQRLADGGLANTEREFSPDRARTTLRGIFASLR